MKRTIDCEVWKATNDLKQMDARVTPVRTLQIDIGVGLVGVDDLQDVFIGRGQPCDLAAKAAEIRQSSCLRGIRVPLQSLGDSLVLGPHEDPMVHVCG